MNINDINKNKQQVINKTDNHSLSHPFAKIWVLLCLRCKNEYGCNGSDAHLRKCPNCQGGNLGEPV